MPKQKRPDLEVLWHEEERTLTLSEEPVLHYRLAWPELRNVGFRGRWINRFYAHMAQVWRQRWEREVYCRACFDLAQRRAESRPFTPWTGRLEGEVVFQDAERLSIRMHGEEIRADGEPCRVQWDDAWNVPEGAPCARKELPSEKN